MGNDIPNKPLPWPMGVRSPSKTWARISTLLGEWLRLSCLGCLIIQIPSDSTPGNEAYDNKMRCRMPPVLYQCLSARLLRHTLIEWTTVCLLCTRHCVWVEGDPKMYIIRDPALGKVTSVRVVVLNQRQFRPPRGHLEISGDVFGCHDGKCAVPLLASRR